MAEVQSAQLYTLSNAFLHSEDDCYRLFGEPDAADLRFVVLHDYVLSVTPFQPKILKQNPVTSFNQLSAAKARLQRQSGIQDFQELSRSLTDKIPNSGGIAFRYTNPSISSMHKILSQTELDNHTNRLLDFLGRGELDSKHEILVGHGYGGLICEQAFMRLQTNSASLKSARAKKRLRGMLLCNTPHFRAGLAQWTFLTAKELNLTTARSREDQDWSGCLDDFIRISRMQAQFADIVEKSASQIRLACCFAKQPDPVTKLFLSPEFCCLPSVEAIEIHNSSHFCVNTAQEDLTYIIERLADWAKAIQEGQKLTRDLLSLRSLAGSSRSNDPAWQWDPQSAKKYWILSWKGKSNMSAVSVALGDIIKEMSSPSSTTRPIATRDDVVPFQYKELIDFGVSRIIKNDFKYWQSLLSPDIEGAGYKIVVREEWSTDRTVEYLKAALQLQAVRESLKVGEPRFHIVTGVIYGSKEADGNTSERSAVLGYQCQKASVVSLTASPPNSTRLVIEQVEVRSTIKTLDQPTITVAPIPEVEAESSGVRFIGEESEAQKLEDQRTKEKPPRRRISRPDTWFRHRYFVK
ncbi:hypothetical protein Z517_03259 [Fonsecaea pedrosoi CBS 271.37]|uniref:DUF676 domain-containing protein n=1 Tax=Fonsecaea pedrosoi CBS 271.37 TaxID=1442368 RepID=A0A0D2GSS1_9EURO|nr:uncharacterized protein Z517_03259 [Fonsecaea pedrosoi CBS 271.37]KIW84013.1 hypothetical protein Z517_03259 [Fonsecaea pedrosoi CBS 271.37]